MVFEGFVEIIFRIRCTCTLHAECENFLLKYFCEWLKVHEIRDPDKFMYDTVNGII